ncbi:MAG TPA: magnesium transporter CorA family protein [Streptosporangiaceae bacterium]|nr:magnesium transporter CorA family protein [Streptosporangiaceae bacterium]
MNSGTQETYRDNGRSAAAAATISESTPTRCQARTRLYRDGKLAAQGFPVDDISEYLKEDAAVVWLDLLDPGQDDLEVLSSEFGLHPLAIEDAEHEHERTKIDRYASHLFLAAYAVTLDKASGELATSELAAFVTSRALITVRKDDGMDVGALVSYWDASPDLAGEGVGYLLHGLLDHVVDGYFAAVQTLDDEIEKLEDLLFADSPREQGSVQRRSFELRKSLVLLRRVVLPMREVVNTVLRRDLRLVSDEMMPYYHDVYDHVLRATEWTESLRDLLTTVLETNLTVQSNRMNVITKKVTSWAAIIAVPTLITGFYGMNVPYPGFGRAVGLEVSAVIMVVAALILYLVFKRKDWL